MKWLQAAIIHRKTAEVIIEEGALITQEMIEALEKENVEDLLMPDNESTTRLKQLLHEYEVATANAGNAIQDRSRVHAQRGYRSRSRRHPPSQSLCRFQA